MVLDTAQESFQERCQQERKGRNQDDCERRPDDEGVPLPKPELSNEPDGVVACGFE